MNNIGFFLRYESFKETKHSTFRKYEDVQREKYHCSRSEHDPHNRIKDDVFSMCEKVVTGRLFCRADNRIFLVHCQLILLLENATPGFSSSDDGEKGGEPMLTREGLKRRERER